MTRGLVALLGLPTASSRCEPLIVRVRDLTDLLQTHMRKEERSVPG